MWEVDKTESEVILNLQIYYLYMSKGHITGSIKFIVKEKVENQRVDYNGTLQYMDCRWFERTEGEKKGLEFIVPIEHPEYSNNMEEQLASLTKYDNVSLKLKSMNEKDTSWICVEVVESSN